MEPTEHAASGRAELTAAQVAHHLGVKLETVYAYVSRGLLHPLRRRGRRESWFAEAEVAALPSRGGRRRPGLTDDLRTRITLVEDGRLSYRGHDVTALAADGGFDRACAVLWERRVAEPVDAATLRRVRAALAALPTGARIADRVRTVVTVSAVLDPWRHDHDPDRVVAAMAGVIATSACALTDRAADGVVAPAGVAVVLADGLGTPHVGWVDLALTLLADHDLAGSTTTARTAASVRADPYGVVLAALSAFDSPLHGRASQQAHAFLAGALADPAVAVARCLAGEPVPGFGHPVYREGDPRAEALIEALARLDGDHPALRTAELIMDAMARRDAVVNVDFALALGSHVLDVPAEAGELIFVHARMAGWTAHLVEEYEAPPLRFRLRGVYTGPRPGERHDEPGSADPSSPSGPRDPRCSDRP